MKKVNLEETLIYRKVLQINHDSYRICRGRNMPPFYSYEKVTQISSVTILVKRRPGE